MGKWSNLAFSVTYKKNHHGCVNSTFKSTHTCMIIMKMHISTALCKHSKLDGSAVILVVLP